MTFPGWLISLVLLLPNLLFFIWQPTAQPQPSPTDNKRRPSFTEICERLGQGGSFVLPFFYRVSVFSALEQALFALMLANLFVYYYGWVRYFTAGRAIRLLLTPIWWIPLPMAICPVLVFLLSGVLMDSPYMVIASLVLGCGHIPVSLSSSRKSTV